MTGKDFSSQWILFQVKLCYNTLNSLVEEVENLQVTKQLRLRIQTDVIKPISQVPSEYPFEQLKHNE